MIGWAPAQLRRRWQKTDYLCAITHVSNSTDTAISSLRGSDHKPYAASLAPKLVRPSHWRLVLLWRHPAVGQDGNERPATTNERPAIYRRADLPLKAGHRSVEVVTRMDCRSPAPAFPSTPPGRTPRLNRSGRRPWSYSYWQLTAFYRPSIAARRPSQSGDCRCGHASFASAPAVRLYSVGCPSTLRPVVAPSVPLFLLCRLPTGLCRQS